MRFMGENALDTTIHFREAVDGLAGEDPPQ
jgi:hypothetical protein